MDYTQAIDLYTLLLFEIHQKLKTHWPSFLMQKTFLDHLETPWIQHKASANLEPLQNHLGRYNSSAFSDGQIATVL